MGQGEWGLWVQRINPSIPCRPERPNDLKQAFWFLTPSQLANEFWLSIAATVLALYTTSVMHPNLNWSVSAYARTRLDCWLLGLLCTSYGLLLWHKEGA